MRKAISVVLLPNEGDSRDLVEFSALINQHVDSNIILDKNHLPHVTIAQYLADESQCGMLWSHVCRFADQVPAMQSTGLGFVPDSKGRVWIELGFLKSRAFDRLQVGIAQLEALNDLSLHNPISDMSRPHITLGLMNILTKLPPVELAGQTIFCRMYENMKLAVGVNGEHFTFTEARYFAGDL